MRYDIIKSQQDLVRFCESVPRDASIAFDTEFVSENNYRPRLCLAQIAVAGRLILLDVLDVHDLTPFWELLASEGVETIVHAGRQELCFCLHAIGRRPYRLFDTQIAAGLIGLEYPAAYSTLTSRLLDKTLSKGETRTHWQRRPLSKEQIAYALSDVLHLHALRDVLYEQLASLDRLEWLEAELVRWQTGIEEAEFSDRWRRMSGAASLSRRSAAIARELWRWRERLAEEQNTRPQRILRDDLIIELARRGSSKRTDIRMLRGMERRDVRKHVDAIADAIQRALEQPCDRWPRQVSRPPNHAQFHLMGQFLTAALGCICREQRVARSLVGTAQDVRDLIAYHMRPKGPDDSPPSLACGWRAEVVGQTLEDLMNGRLAVRVSDPTGEEPLEIVSLES